MPSLRRSLIAYFLVLLGLALLAYAIVIDRFAHETLRARQDSETKRIDEEHDRNVQDAEEKFNEQMFAHARTLGLQLRQVYQGITQEAQQPQQRRPLTPEQLQAQEIQKRVPRQFDALMVALAFGDMNPVGPSFVLQGITGYRNSRTALFGSALGWPTGTPINTTAIRVQQSFDLSDHPDYFQIHTNLSPSKPILPKGVKSLDLPLDTTGLSEPNDTRYEDIDIPQVGHVRRLVYRSFINTPSFWGRTPQPGGGRPPGVGAPGGRPPNTGDGQAVYVQYLRKLSELDDIKTAQQSNRDAQLALIEAETRESHERLRIRVAGIAGLTFVALFVGGWFIIGIGLSPLRKLTTAVSRVNERDFRLNMERTDLTVELLPIHDKLNQSLDALRIAFEREKEAIADISHELRTPVAGLLATLDVALRRPRTAEQYQKALEECRAISKQLAHLVERVMTLAYLDADQTQVTRTETDAAALAEGCASIIRPLSESQSVTFNTDIDGPTTLDTDPHKLREVMINLLHNAVEYNRPGGQIDLRVRPGHGGGAVVEVADTGIGMTAEVQAKIFERFYRADPSRTQTGVHAGLGLAIVKEYVNRLGGTIAVESKLGQGTTFRVTLPA